MHCVNLRTDLHRPPFVSIGKPMPLSNPFPAGPDEPASAAEIAEARDAAVAERDALQSQRTVFILDGTPEDVAEIDRQLALVAVRIEQLVGRGGAEDDRLRGFAAAAGGLSGGAPGSEDCPKFQKIGAAARPG